MSGKILTTCAARICAVLMCAVPVGAEELSKAEYLAFECNACHLKGQDNGIAPAITGRPADEIEAALLAYRNKELPNVVMQVVAGRLDAQEITALAGYLQDVQP